MHKIFLSSAPVICMACGAFAQDVVGDWLGTLKAGPQAIHMILHIIKGNGGGLAAKLDILVADHPTHILFRANYKNCFGNLGSIKE
jgi:hypothetical protein